MRCGSGPVPCGAMPCTASRCGFPTGRSAPRSRARIGQVDDQPTALWKLRREDDEVACQVRLMPYGIEVDILHNGAVVLTRVFATDNEALAWSDEKRTARQSQGWLAAPEPEGPTHGRPA